MLIYKLVEMGSKRGNKLFDMYTGYQFYKDQWSDKKDGIVCVEMRPGDIYGRLDRFVSKTFLYPAMDFARKIKNRYV